MIILMGDYSSLPCSNPLSSSEATLEKKITNSPPTLPNPPSEVNNNHSSTFDSFATCEPSTSHILLPSNVDAVILENNLKSNRDISNNEDVFTQLNLECELSRDPTSTFSLPSAILTEESSNEFSKSQINTFSYSIPKSKNTNDSNFRSSYASTKDGTLIFTNLGKTYPSLTRIDTNLSSEAEKPKDSAQTEDFYEEACRKIQNWWRINQLKRQFYKLKHRPSASVNGSMNVLKHSHSRKESEEYPLKHVNNEYVSKFNLDPTFAVNEMLSGPLFGIQEPHEIISTFLVLNEHQIDRTKLGDYFGQP
ncbi:hypothetical protein HMI56_005694, partial [Coelomomyces lativittatus]